MTGFHEIFQSAPQVAHQAKELVDLEMRSNLLQKLVESGHPYGLLLSQSNTSSTNGSSESLINFFFPVKKGEQKGEYRALKNRPVKNELDASSYLSSSSSLPLKLPLGQIYAASFLNSSLLNSIEPLMKRIPVIGEKLEGKGQNVGDWSLNRKENSINHYAVGFLLALSSKSSALESAKKNPDVAQKLHLEGVFRQTFLAPTWLKIFAGENLEQERKRELVVDQNGVGLGTAAVKLATFRGQEPYVIKSPKGEGVAQINPGDPIGHIHLSHQASLIRQLSPMEKVSAMTEDLLALFSAIDKPIEESLEPQQQETLTRAKKATIIGISHLVRLFSRKTGLPTWKLDVLPELVQKFHQHDSQAVSKAFGGSRKVRPADVEMMVLTPEMRRQLVAELA